MAEERALVRKSAFAERRPAIASRISPVSAASHATPAARTLQQRLGNQGTQAFAAQMVARSSAPGVKSTIGIAATQLSISQPGDAHEREADRVAEAVMRMPEPDPKASSIHPASTISPASTLHRRCAAV